MFNTIFKQEREKLKITQTELSQHFNVSQQTIGSWETGRTEPNSDMLVVIANFFNVSTDYLLGKKVSYSSKTTLDPTVVKDSVSKYLTIDDQLKLIIETLGSPDLPSIFEDKILNKTQCEILISQLETILNNKNWLYI